MIQEQKTKEEFGYNTKDLTKGSSKKIYVKCDYCQQDYQTTYKIYNKGREIIQKDGCKKCRYKKREDISLAKYGVKNSAQRDDVRKKISDKCEGFDEKRLKIIREKYGSNSAMHNETVRQKHKDAIMNKYGVENVSQIQEVKDKVKKTNLEKFGNEYFLGSEEGRRKSIEGVQKKYGVDNVFQSEEIKDKSRKTNLSKYGYEHFLKNLDVAKKHADKIVEIKKLNGTIKLYEGKSAKEWAIERGYSTSRFSVLLKKYGFDQAKLMDKKESYIERDMRLWLENNNINYKQQFAVENKVADFYLPDYGLIIEVDGLYWHSELEQSDNTYHVDKRLLYIDNNYKSLFFREDEINTKFDIISSIIHNSIGRSNKLFARKCQVNIIPKDQAKVFLQTNHLMGKGRGLTYALTHAGEVVSALAFCRLEKDNWEISRFCHKLNTQVVGGFSRLIKHFLNEHKVDKLTTFIDLRYGSGDYLPDLGFKFVNCSPSFKWTDSIQTFNRMRFKGNSGYDHGLCKIWDCGQAKYELVT